MNFDRGFAYTCGIILLAFGICGFIPAFLVPAMAVPSDVGTPGAVIPLLHGELLHYFPVNVVLSSIYVLIGLAGLWMAGQPTIAHRYAQIVCLVYAALAALGCVAQTSSLFGLAPLGGHDVGLHIFIAAIAGTFGFIIRAGLDHDWYARGKGPGAG